MCFLGNFISHDFQICSLEWIRAGKKPLIINAMVFVLIRRKLSTSRSSSGLFCGNWPRSTFKESAELISRSAGDLIFMSAAGNLHRAV